MIWKAPQCGFKLLTVIRPSNFDRPAFALYREVVVQCFFLVTEIAYQSKMGCFPFLNQINTKFSWNMKLFGNVPTHIVSLDSDSPKLSPPRLLRCQNWTCCILLQLLKHDAVCTKVKETFTVIFLISKTHTFPHNYIKHTPHERWIYFDK